MYSNSRINCFKMCPKQFEYRYIKNLYPIGESDALFLGKLLHKGVELKDQAKFLEFIENENIVSSEKTETLITLALAMTEAYFKVFGYNEIVHNELYFKLPLENHILQGYIDGIIEEDDGLWLLEIKTASQVNKDYLDKLKFNDQINKYLYAAHKNVLENFNIDKPILGVKYRIIKKPQIRQKQSESIMQFRQRLVEKLQEEDYITEIILKRTVDELEESIQDTIQDINMIEQTTRFTKTLSACSTYGRCAYMELCCKEENAEALYIERVERGEENE